ncbi:hypothetical protein MASR2M12_05450 [Bacteroidales bacterium]
MQRFCLTVFFLWLAFSSIAQVSSPEVWHGESGWSVGLAAGMVSGHIDQAGRDYAIGNKTGFQGGMIADVVLSENVRLRAELLFERRSFGIETAYNGFRLTDTSAYVCWKCYYESNIEYTSDYLQLPLVITFNKPAKWFDYGAEAGLFMSLLTVSRRQGYEEVFLHPKEALPFVASGFEPGLSRLVYAGKAKDVMRTHDAGLVIGVRAGKSFLHGLQANLNARVQLGLSGVFENPQMPAFTFAGYMIRIEILYPILRHL